MVLVYLQFPVDEQIIAAIKLRVNIARSLDKLLLDQRKEEAQKNWLKKAAEEAELEISEDEDNDDKVKKADLKAKIKVTKTKLASMLASPLHAQRYGGKYLTMTGALKFPTDFQSSGKALKAMKSKSKWIHSFTIKYDDNNMAQLKKSDMMSQ